MLGASASSTSYLHWLFNKLHKRDIRHYINFKELLIKNYKLRIINKEL